MVKIDEDEFNHLMNNFETTDLLRAVEDIDKARSYLNDRDYGAPPEIRDDLLKLHSVAMDIINNGWMDKTQEMFEMATSLEMEVFDLIEHLQSVLTTLENLTSLYPESLTYASDEE